MITIERGGGGSGGNGFKMSFKAPGMGWRGYSVIAHGLREVNLAVQHYMGGKEGGLHVGERKHCPLCELIQRETKKDKIGK
ncbi:MAG: hypothetical protein IMZ62_12780 [Chloroflexi bacterium]|nr:hypothetical protein [Chloroflexota bacterium]